MIQVVDKDGEAQGLGEMTQQTGVCKYCGQRRMIYAPEGYSEEALAHAAMLDCTCKDARAEQQRLQRVSDAKDYIDNIFEQSSALADFAKDTIDIVEGEEVESISIRVGHFTHTFRKDAKGMLKITSVKRVATQEEF